MKLLYFLMIATFCLGLTGCGNKKDLDNQLKLLEELDVEEVFSKDYRIEYSDMSEDELNGSLQTIKYDNGKLYVYNAVKTNGTVSYYRLWIGKKNDGKFYAFYDNGSSKKYVLLSEDLAKTLVSSYKLGNFGEDIFDVIVEKTRSYYKLCSEKGNSCDIESDLFSTYVEFEFEKESEIDSEEYEVKILEGRPAYFENDVLRGNQMYKTVIEFDYSEQEIVLPSDEGYIYSEDLIYIL